ncbi:MAG: Uncharacterized protein AWU58_817 [Methanohalophilus sp. T328-1]|jgi:hypothetical protein|nr:MAG: Uncharacterized protein AWU58_817 [Methanohalophilus sp. T328-1]
MKIDAIWEELENDKSFHSGLLYKRYSAKIKPNIFISLKAPEKFRCISFLIDSSFEFDKNQLKYLRDIKIESAFDPLHPGKKFILVLLLNKQYNDIFTTLCQDLIDGLSEIDNEDILIEKLIERLIKWQSLFEKAGESGLSESSQRGLFGEMYFLRKCLSKSLHYIDWIKAWKGPEKSIQDFQYSDWAVEVKTTHGKNHQKIHISSERQLDDSIIPNIFLYHLSFDIRPSHGETLNSVIEDIFSLLSTSSADTNLLRLKLIESGYFEIHKEFYENTGYTIRGENIYNVQGSFPRITEKQVPVGVGDVKYSIVLSHTEEWNMDESELFKRLCVR